MIDVVIPVFNGERYLGEAVGSALGQTLPPARVIIVDDGSTDDTEAIATGLASAHPGRVEYLRTEHRGVSAARNSGIAVSSAPFVAFLDADDVWLPEKLALQRAVFDESSPDVGLVHCSYVNIDEEGRIIDDARVVPPQRRGSIFDALLFEDYVLSGSASAAVVRRDHLDRAGHFDEQLSHGEDWDLWLRLAAICHVDFAPEPLVQIRIHPGSAQRAVSAGRGANFALQRMLVFRKWADKGVDFADRKAQMRGQIATMLLADSRRLSEIERFYRMSQRQGDVLFSGRRQLWSALLRQAVRLRVLQLYLRKMIDDVRRRRERG